MPKLRLFTFKNEKKSKLLFLKTPPLYRLSFTTQTKILKKKAKGINCKSHECTRMITLKFCAMFSECPPNEEKICTLPVINPLKKSVFVTVNVSEWKMILSNVPLKVF